MGYNAAGKSTLTDQFVLRNYHRLNRDLFGGSIDALAVKADHLIKGADRCGFQYQHANTFFK